MLMETDTGKQQWLHVVVTNTFINKIMVIWLSWSMWGLKKYIMMLIRVRPFINSFGIKRKIFIARRDSGQSQCVQQLHWECYKGMTAGSMDTALTSFPLGITLRGTFWGNVFLLNNKRTRSPTYWLIIIIVNMTNNYEDKKIHIYKSQMWRSFVNLYESGFYQTAAISMFLYHQTLFPCTYGHIYFTITN